MNPRHMSLVFSILLMDSFNLQNHISKTSGNVSWFLHGVFISTSYIAKYHIQNTRFWAWILAVLWMFWLRFYRPKMLPYRGTSFVCVVHRVTCKFKSVKDYFPHIRSEITQWNVWLATTPVVYVTKKNSSQDLCFAIVVMSPRGMTYHFVLTDVWLSIHYLRSLSFCCLKHLNHK